MDRRASPWERRLGVASAVAEAAAGLVWVLFALPGCGERQAAAVSPHYPVEAHIPVPGLSSDAFILGYLEAANRGDRAGGRLAQIKASDSRVREFGRDMADQHDLLLRQTEQTSASLRIPPAFNADSLEVSREEREAMEELRRKTGPAFDRAYLRHEIESHQAVVDRLKRAILEAHNPEVRQLIDDSQPVVQAHLDAALALNRELGASGPQ